MAVDNTYLSVSVDRVAAMLLAVSSTFTPAVKRVFKYIDSKSTPPFWWMYPGVVGQEALAAWLDRQTFAINMRLVLGMGTQGYDGTLVQNLWLWMPTVLNYFDQRKALVYQAGQTPPRNLDIDNVRIRQISPFGTFSNHNHVGIECQLVLPFTISLEPEPGNL
jgi:hypothetical protein